MYLHIPLIRSLDLRKPLPQKAVTVIRWDWPEAPNIDRLLEQTTAEKMMRRSMVFQEAQTAANAA